MKCSEKLAAIESGEPVVDWYYMGNAYTVADYDAYFVLYFNGDVAGVVDTAEQVDTWASVNHYTA